MHFIAVAIALSQERLIRPPSSVQSSSRQASVKSVYQSAIMRHLNTAFAKRAPRCDAFVLNFKTIYVFFSRQGALFLALLLLTFVVGVNYGNNLVLAVFFYLLSVWLVSVVLTFLQLFGLKISLQAVQLGAAGEVVMVQFVAQSLSARQVEFAFEYTPDELQKLAQFKVVNYTTVSKSHSQTCSIVGKQTIILPIVLGKRGAHALPRLVVKTYYPLGVSVAWSYGYFARQSLAYPAPKAAMLEFNRAIGEMGGSARAGLDEFDGLSPLLAGESFARVSWAHLARGQGMLAKRFADPVGKTPLIDYQQMPAAAHEDKLAQMAHLILTHQGAFGVVLPDGTARHGSGDGFKEDILRQLALVD